MTKEDLNQHYAKRKQNYKYQPTHMKIFNVYTDAYTSAYHQINVCSKKKKKRQLKKVPVFQRKHFF